MRFGTFQKRAAASDDMQTVLYITYFERVRFHQYSKDNGNVNLQQRYNKR